LNRGGALRAFVFSRRLSVLPVLPPSARVDFWPARRRQWILALRRGLTRPNRAPPPPAPIWQGHCWNGFTWRLKLTVKPPDTEAGGVDMNIHVGLCWSVEVGGRARAMILPGPSCRGNLGQGQWEGGLPARLPTRSESGA
jgi:hypothetical protein